MANDLGIKKRRKVHSKLLQCLGKEEASFHVNKNEGIFYKLNQELISEIILLEATDLKSEFLEDICNSKVSSALELLKTLIFEGKNIFIYKAKNKIQLNMDKANTDKLIQRVPEIFSQYISHLQAISPTPNCLNENVQGLSELNNELKYLQEEKHPEQIFTKKKLVVIFNSLQNIDGLFKKCSDQIKAKAPKQ